MNARGDQLAQPSVEQSCLSHRDGAKCEAGKPDGHGLAWLPEPVRPVDHAEALICCDYQAAGSRGVRVCHDRDQSPIRGSAHPCSRAAASAGERARVVETAEGDGVADCDCAGPGVGAELVLVALAVGGEVEGCPGAEHPVDMVHTAAAPTTARRRRDRTMQRRWTSASPGVKDGGPVRAGDVPRATTGVDQTSLSATGGLVHDATMSMGRRPRLGVCLLSAAVLLVGCQSRSGSPPSPAEQTAPSSPVAASTPNPDVTAPLATGIAGPPQAISTAHGRCGPTSVEVTASANPSGATGQHGVLISVHNIGREPCSLLGYPVLQLLDGRHLALPFAYVHKGGQAVTSAKPRPVALPVNGTAYLGFGKYRCDLAGSTAAASLRITLPNDGNRLPITVDLRGEVGNGTAYCGPKDPGDTINVSPVVETEQAVSPQL